MNAPNRVVGAGGSGIVVARAPTNGINFTASPGTNTITFVANPSSPSGVDQVATFTTSGDFGIADGDATGFFTADYLVVGW
jgi:hypothetical protein